TSKVYDKSGRQIHEGDTVMTKLRGGKWEGIVDEIVTSESQAQEQGVKNPPKVLFTGGQHGHDVAHNPQTLSVREKQNQSRSR
ncbi:hypothetical protein K435DRAFT_669326, partial [Dendrothele bispora CBS 962.96]